MKKLVPGDDAPLKAMSEEIAKASADALVEELTIDTLARTIWGEARGEGSLGMQGVAAVIMNRFSVSKARGGYWWGNSVIEICQKPYQFSCWNRDDPNYPKLIKLDERDVHFASALRVARRAVLGALSDPTRGATHYHAGGITPYWAKDKKPCAVIGRHIFYVIID